ncbi:unnamed protein product [Leptosia nina]|uniref:Uncharacterized protein n=1 Tax=Leptosia nina TaxID=320188 RepID=A0AAV1JME9_9NEOP
MEIAISRLQNVDRIEASSVKEISSALSKIPLEIPSPQEMRPGTILVPVIDHDLQRLGLTSTTFRPKAVKKALRTEESALKVIAKNVDVKNMDSGNWLAYEAAALGQRNAETDVNVIKRVVQQE